MTSLGPGFSARDDSWPQQGPYFSEKGVQMNKEHIHFPFNYSAGGGYQAPPRCRLNTTLIMKLSSVCV